MEAADPCCAMLAEMTGSAYGLGMAFAAEAERADEIGRKIEYAKLFDRCFFAVRVGIALELRLRREGRLDVARADREDRDDLSDGAERDPSEDESPERCEQERPVQYVERDRDREVERASLPQLLGALEGGATDAGALPGPPPAELLSLRDLLARYASDNTSGSAPGPALRTRLAGSAAGLPARPVGGQTLTLSPPAPPGARDGPRLRGATGPPRA